MKNLGLGIIVGAALLTSGCAETPPTCYPASGGASWFNSTCNVGGETIGDKVEKAMRVSVRGDRIYIVEKVHFDTGKATIQSMSYGLLDEVVTVLKNHSEITKVRVEGHTDSDGELEFNMQLSKDRAAAVVEYITSHGIDEGRLVSQGFGPDRPVASNDTADGKASNRRVEFHIIERSN